MIILLMKILQDYKKESMKCTVINGKNSYGDDESQSSFELNERFIKRDKPIILLTG